MRKIKFISCIASFCLLLSSIIFRKSNIKNGYTNLDNGSVGDIIILETETTEIIL